MEETSLTGLAIINFCLIVVLIPVLVGLRRANDQRRRQLRALADSRFIRRRNR